MMYWGEHMTTGDWVFSILGTLIVVALVAGVVVWLVSSARTSTSTAGVPHAESAREILDRRLAGGEPTVEQYDQLLERLGEGSSPATNAQRSERAGASG
jgi:uncharacterized membrane protein